MSWASDLENIRTLCKARQRRAKPQKLPTILIPILPVCTKAHRLVQDYAHLLRPTLMVINGGALTSLLSKSSNFFGVGIFMKLFARPRLYSIAASAAARSIVKGAFSTS